MSLNAYIEACRSRLQRRSTARRAAAVAAALLLLTAIFAWIFVVWVPGSGFVAVTRVLVFGLAFAGVAALFLWRPHGIVDVIEQRVFGFEGRLETWFDATSRGEKSPMLDLLGEQTAAMASTAPDRDVIPAREIALPAVGAGLLLVALFLLVFTGSNPWQLAAKRLWTGDLFAATVPRILVTPGDTVIPKGRNVVIEAEAVGFDPQGMQVHALFANADDWEQATMMRVGEDKFGFVFVGVNEEVSYYVGAKRLNSERHVIRVADLPRITQVKVDYTYPSWTGVEPEQVLDGDVAAVKGTDVAITATADGPLQDALIIVNGEELTATAAGNSLSSGFAVEQPGNWHVAVRHEGTLAQISDTFLINTIPDRAPQVAFTWPGHDRQATSIEEIGFEFEAEDDFVLEGLAMNYAVNGGEWRQVQLDLEDPSHMLYLEELTVLEADVERNLAAGDMLTFYAEARDHTQESKTALYFIDVRPFDRVYRERQSGGGGGGGGGNQGGFEIAERQREIVTATWNLINKTESGEGERTVQDQAETLALLQRTLKEQVETLTARTEARMLTRDAEIDQFTKELMEAVEFMEPAAKHLENIELREAIKPAQLALQNLLAAEATMTDVDVTMGNENGRGSSGRSLSELVDLEMDRERNRYETQQSPNLSNEAEDDGDWRKLEELARRQEQLGADRQNQSDESLASRWQQERLKRELEQIQEELQRQRDQQQGRGTQSQSLDNAISDVSQARQAMTRAMENPSGGQGAQSAQNEAAQAMRNAAQAMRENERSRLDQRLERASQQAENLLEDQRNAIERLEEVQQESLAAARRGEGNPFRNYAMEPYADAKRRMQDELAGISGELGEVSDALAGRDPETRRTLERAMQELRDEDVSERLSASADAFAIGRPLFALDNEEMIAAALERFVRRIEQAQRGLAESSVDLNAQSPLAQVREMRRALTGGSLAGGGTNVEIDRGELNSIRRATDDLEARVQELLQGDAVPDMNDSRTNYVPRGINRDNDENLAQLLKDRLDLLEASLLNLDRAPIHAQRPRDIQRDSDVAAEYFRELSAAEHTSEAN